MRCSVRLRSLSIIFISAGFYQAGLEAEAFSSLAKEQCGIFVINSREQIYVCPAETLILLVPEADYQAISPVAAIPVDVRPVWHIIPVFNGCEHRHPPRAPDYREGCRRRRAIDDQREDR
jgi:hypothetical protein